jgi:hypothetical protein
MSTEEVELAPQYMGFDRVLIDADGTAIPHHRAVQAGFTPKVGFMRKDGWSLGAPSNLELAAFRLWQKEWSYRIDLPASEWRKIT